MNTMNYYVDVILPIPLYNRFTYQINRDEAQFLKPGMRVAVPFGKSKIYTSIVYGVHQSPPVGYNTKEIYQILDETPIVTPTQLKHWEWVANYYLCTLGEVVRAALSKSFLLESETMVVLNTSAKVDAISLSEDEQMVYKAINAHRVLSIQEVSHLLDKVNVLPIVYKLVDKNLVSVEEEIIETYKPKLLKYVKLNKAHASDSALHKVLDSLSAAPKQKEALLTYFTLQQRTTKDIALKVLQQKGNVSSGVIKALVDKGVFDIYHLQIDRVSYNEVSIDQPQTLNPAQTQALEQLRETFQKKNVALLHGVTSSGKTEIYVNLINDFLNKGQQVLYMLPEIALTTQLISRLQQYFGNKIAVYHSRYSANERVEVWHNVLTKNPKAQLVIGARSAQFLPFQNLGLVVIDEEHESSFKQYNPAPRYHARDSAIVLANFHSAKIVLGSATPSLESYYNAQHQKYGFVEITERYGDVQMPKIQLVDLKEVHFKKKMTGHFSKQLLDKMESILSADEQIILFQNRRGFAPIMECQTCGHAPQCSNCDVSLTYHQHRNQLRCHYCGYTMAKTVACMACGSPYLDFKGLGTQQIETELKALFPTKNIARMDQDTTRGKHGHAKLIYAFEQGEIDILIGTQMIAKGLDFRNVGLVGVLQADSLLNFPDFRAHERAFQLLLQVAGRTGRTQKQGQVLIQTYAPQHPVIQQVKHYDYTAMYETQIIQRREFNYPPYFRLIRITIKHRNRNTLHTASKWFESAMKNVFKEHVLGPETPPVGRIKNEYLMHIILKIPQQQSLHKTKEVILKIQKSFWAIKEFRSVKTVLDVDPY